MSDKEKKKKKKSKHSKDKEKKHKKHKKDKEDHGRKHKNKEDEKHKKRKKHRHDKSDKIESSSHPPESQSNSTDRNTAQINDAHVDSFNIQLTLSGNGENMKTKSSDSHQTRSNREPHTNSPHPNPQLPHRYGYQRDSSNQIPAAKSILDEYPSYSDKDRHQGYYHSTATPFYPTDKRTPGPSSYGNEYQDAINYPPGHVSHSDHVQSHPEYNNTYPYRISHTEENKDFNPDPVYDDEQYSKNVSKLKRKVHERLLPLQRDIASKLISTESQYKSIKSRKQMVEDEIRWEADRALQRLECVESRKTNELTKYINQLQAKKEHIDRCITQSSHPERLPSRELFDLIRDCDRISGMHISSPPHIVVDDMDAHRFMNDWRSEGNYERLTQHLSAKDEVIDNLKKELSHKRKEHQRHLSDMRQRYSSTKDELKYWMDLAEMYEHKLRRVQGHI
eukprot:gb/GECH01014679.1/.p1 GENE.gb/GECH01014679.1/~~gb/GECH01014679.1/.p1  ORF type:complete len:449 (+),score=121.23 gb/GECH01014679.1/:1-1347(+)